MNANEIVENAVKTLLTSYLRIFAEPDLYKKVGFAMCRLPQSYYTHARAIKVFEIFPTDTNSMYYIPDNKPMKIRRIPKSNALELKHASKKLKENLTDTNACADVEVSIKVQIIKIYIEVGNSSSDLAILEDHAKDAETQIKNIMNICKCMLLDIKNHNAGLETISFIGDTELELVDSRIPDYKHPNKIIFRVVLSEKH